MSDAAGRQLILFADAMCSWCYGFAPVVAALEAEFGDALPIKLINGGLRPGNIKAMTADDRSRIRGYWEQVRDASGQPFDFRFFDREGFVYDTEPAARAVVLVRDRDEKLAIPYYSRVLTAFFGENNDITQPEVLAGFAAEFGLDRDAFLAAFAEEEAKVQAWTDFTVAQRTGVTGFPTLIAGTGQEDGWSLITQGFQPKDRVLSTVSRWLAGQA